LVFILGVRRMSCCIKVVQREVYWPVPSNEIEQVVKTSKECGHDFEKTVENRHS
jgi:hypothetical protein